MRLRDRRHHAAALGGVLALAMLARGAPSTLVLADPAGAKWQAAVVHRLVTPEVFVEQTLERVDGLARIVLVRAPSALPAGALPPPDLAASFAETVKKRLAAGSGPVLADTAVRRLGRDGREQRFTLVRDGRTYACELFVFADGAVECGILCAQVAEGAPPPIPLLECLQVLEAPPPGVVALAPFKVNGDAITSFPISLRIIGDRRLRRVIHLLVTDALRVERDFGGGPSRDFDEESPIEVGDEIVTIDGRPATDFASAMGRDTELGRIFLNRHPGDEVRLQLVSARTHRPYDTTLRVPELLLGAGRR